MEIFDWCMCGVAALVLLLNFGWYFFDIFRGILQMYRKCESFFDSSSRNRRDAQGFQNGRIVDNSFLEAPVTRMQFNLKSGNDELDEEPQPCTSTQALVRASNVRKIQQRPPICCSACEERKKTVLTELDSSDLINVLDCDTRLPHNPWYIRRFAFFIFFWRKWHIGPQFHMVSLKDMVGDDRVNRAVDEVARNEFAENPDGEPLEEIIDKHAKIAERTVANMRGKQSANPYFGLYVRFASWIIGKTLSRIYPRILCRKSQLERIAKARDSGYRIIYLPVHRSHLDYVLVSWVLAASGFRSPLVAAGDNLNIPIFSLMMKSVGGFFIKRRLDRSGKRDILYRAILYSYMERSIMDDNDLEFFVEGGRTRTGKPCHPKGGLLNIAIDTLLTGKVDDLLIVPVNFSYEKLVEGNYIREQLGKLKINESFASAALALWNSVQHTKFGNARIDFGRPFSVKEFMGSYKAWTSPSRLVSRAHSSDSSSSDSDLTTTNNNSDVRVDTVKGGGHGLENRRDFIDSIAQHVIYDGVQNFSLMSTNVISFLLLSKFRDGVTVDELAVEMQILKEEMELRNHFVDIAGDMKEVINHGINVLGPSLIYKDLVVIGEDTRPQVLLKPIVSLPNVLDLAYYSTCVTPIYALDSVIATSLLYIAGKESGPSSSKTKNEMCVTGSDLISVCLELCELLYNEFIFKPPCQTMEQAIRHALLLMKERGLIKFNYEQYYTEDSDEEVVDFSKVDLVFVSMTKDVLERLGFLHGLIRPILDTYAVSSFVLKRLVDCEAREKELHMDMLAEVKSHLKQRFITYGESLALDPIRNFVKVLLSWGILATSDNTGELVYSLETSFDNESAVYEVIRKVGKFQV